MATREIVKSRWLAISGTYPRTLWLVSHYTQRTLLFAFFESTLSSPWLKPDSALSTCTQSLIRVIVSLGTLPTKPVAPHKTPSNQWSVSIGLIVSWSIEWGGSTIPQKVNIVVKLTVCCWWLSNLLLSKVKSVVSCWTASWTGFKLVSIRCLTPPSTLLNSCLKTPKSSSYFLNAKPIL